MKRPSLVVLVVMFVLVLVNDGQSSSLRRDYIAPHCYGAKKPINGTSDKCQVFVDCGEALVHCGCNTSGVFMINPDNKSKPFQVYCDQETDGGGWIVIQRRQDDLEGFFRGWKDYNNGFGDLTKSFWLGLDKIHRLNTDSHLRVDLVDWDENAAFAVYNAFSVSNETTNYTLSIGDYLGNVDAPPGDSLSYHRGMSFTTKDHDDDKLQHENCAEKYNGGWWYKDCHQSNLNGLYFQDGRHTAYGQGVDWASWKGYYYSLKRVEMKTKSARHFKPPPSKTCPCGGC